MPRNETKTVAFAVDIRNDKGCQSALRCAFERGLICRGQTVKLVYVKQDASPVLPPYGSNEMSIRREPDVETAQVFLPYRCFCLLRQVECELVVLQHPDVAKALMEYAASDGVDNFLIISGSQWRWLPRLMLQHTSIFVRKVRKSAPKFCNVYVVSKRKPSKVHSATCSAPSGSGSRRSATPPLFQQVAEEERSLIVATAPRRSNNDSIIIRSRGRSQDDVSVTSVVEVQHSFVNSSSGRTSTESTFISFYNNLPKLELHHPQRIFIKSKIETTTLPVKSLRQLTISSDPAVRDSAWKILQNMEDKEDMKRRLEQKLQQTMDMYHAARKRLALAKGSTRYMLEQQPASSLSPSLPPSPS